MRSRARGCIDSPIWIIAEAPSEMDIKKGYIHTDGIGYVLDKMLQDAELPSDCFIYPFVETLDLVQDLELRKNTLITLLEIKHPSLLVTLGPKVTGLLVPETKSKSKPFECKLNSYSGSLLSSPFLSYSHYCIPTYTPNFICTNWSFRDITVSIDFGHVREEYEYWLLNKKLNPLPARKLIVEPSFEELINFLGAINSTNYISVDIETIRPVKASQIEVRHGYCYCISIATSPWEAISFSIWDYTTIQLVKIWQLLDKILREVPQIGQNYFSFDAHYLETLGFRPCLEKCQDTLIRHHILWPELEHKLQFQTRQYTRQPFYKDEGKGWSPKYKKALMRYNALDTTITYEIFLAQDKEFQERPHLI